MNDLKRSKKTKRIKRSSAYEKAQALKGKLSLKINLKESRERTSRT